MQTKNARLARWSLYLQSWTFKVQYRKRMGNGNADGLSWGPSLGQIYCPPEAEEDVMK